MPVVETDAPVPGDKVNFEGIDLILRLLVLPVLLVALGLALIAAALSYPTVSVLMNVLVFSIPLAWIALLFLKPGHL